MDKHVASRVGALAVGLGMALAAGTGVASAAPDSDGSASSTSASSESPRNSSQPDAESAESSDTESDSSASQADDAGTDAPETEEPGNDDTEDSDDTDDTDDTDEPADTDYTDDADEAADAEPAGHSYSDRITETEPTHDTVESPSRTEDSASDEPHETNTEADASPAEDTTAAAESRPLPAAPGVTSTTAATKASDTLSGVNVGPYTTPTPAAPAGALAWFSSMAAWVQREVDYFVHGGTTPVSDPRQILVDTSTGVVLGTLNTISDSRDHLTFDVVTDPRNGTVVVDANGGFVYTPASAADGGSTDSFTVAVRNQGFNLPTLFGLLNPSANTTMLGVTVNVPGVVTPAPGSQSTWKFQVYNASTHTLKLTKNQESLVNPSGPPPGAVILPGEFHEFDFDDYGLTTTSVISVAYVAVDDAAVVYNLDLNLSAVLMSTFVDCSATRGACVTSAQWGKFGPTVTAMVDPTGTHVVVTADDKQRQAEILQQICTTSSQTTCSFTATNRETVYSGREVAAAFLNRADHAFSYSKEITKTVSDKTSVEVSTKASTKIADVVSVEIAAQYSQDWTTTQTVKRVFDLQVSPGHMATIYAEHPMIRYTGDFTLTMGNSTWNLEGVYFDLPDTSGVRPTVWTVTQAPAAEIIEV